MGLFKFFEEGARNTDKVTKMYCPNCNKKTRHRTYPFSSTMKSTCLECGYKH